MTPIRADFSSSLGEQSLLIVVSMSLNNNRCSSSSAGLTFLIKMSSVGGLTGLCKLQALMCRSPIFDTVADTDLFHECPKFKRTNRVIAALAIAGVTTQVVHGVGGMLEQVGMLFTKDLLLLHIEPPLIIAYFNYVFIHDYCSKVLVFMNDGLAGTQVTSEVMKDHFVAESPPYPVVIRKMIDAAPPQARCIGLDEGPTLCVQPICAQPGSH